MAKQQVAIVGRPNVGKSTLFNRLIGQRHAIVGDQAGITRDRIQGTFTFQQKTIPIMDTGGYRPQEKETMESQVQAQVERALADAALIIFVVDVKAGITQWDQYLAQQLRKAEKSVITVVNKVDNEQREVEAAEFYNLGVGELLYVSALHNRGITALKEYLAKHAPAAPAQEQDQQVPRVAVLGRPNVGKSSFINTIRNEERHIVTEEPGTTRDTVDTLCHFQGQPVYLVDTGGLRKKKKVDEEIEYYANMRTIRAIEHSDVSILMIDGWRGIQQQDLHIFRLIEERKKGVVVVVNKWDLLPKEPGLAEAFGEIIRNRTAPFTKFPIVYMSAKTKQRAFKPIAAALQVYENRNRRITTSTLNKVMQQIIKENPPPAPKGKHIKIKYMTQVQTVPPVFAVYCNHPSLVANSYKRYLIRQINEHFDFSGVPLTIAFKEK